MKSASSVTSSSSSLNGELAESLISVSSILSVLTALGSLSNFPLLVYPNLATLSASFDPRGLNWWLRHRVLSYPALTSKVTVSPNISKRE
jgi:hypothetical protein